MNAQQLHDYIIKPTLEYMCGNYNSPAARLLLLGTSAIESGCGYYIKQKGGGPALGMWQMESNTHDDIFANCDAMQDINRDISKFKFRILGLTPSYNFDEDFEAVSSDLIDSPKYACAMARLKYSMDSNPLPEITGKMIVDERAFYEYYKKIYNTSFGASTFLKWQIACDKHNIFKVKL